MKAFAYIRVSGKAQVDGDGPDRQRDKIADFCKKNSIEFLTDFFEQGVSGTVEAFDRPAFVEMLSEIDRVDRAWLETHEANGDIAKYPQMPCVRLEEKMCVVVERMDRLARDLMVQEMLLVECRKRGIRVYATDQGLVDVANDGGDPSRTLIRQIFGAIAQWEKSVIVMKTRSARDRIRKATGRCEGVKPYGELPGESTILGHIRNWRSQGLAYRDIAGSLNLSGYKTRHGQPWTKKHVANVLQTQRKNNERRTNTADNRHQ